MRTIKVCRNHPQKSYIIIYGYKDGNEEKKAHLQPITRKKKKNSKTSHKTSKKDHKKDKHQRIGKETKSHTLSSDKKKRRNSVHKLQKTNNKKNGPSLRTLSKSRTVQSNSKIRHKKSKFSMLNVQPVEKRKHNRIPKSNVNKIRRRSSK